MGETLDEHSDGCSSHLVSFILASITMRFGSTAGDSEANGDN
jgi:hypothetical protein